MTEYSEWLGRRELLTNEKRLRTILRKRVGAMGRGKIPPVSAKRKVELEVYRLRRPAFLKAHPQCVVCHKAKSRDVHHVKGRLGGAYLDESTWLAVCRNCHSEIHNNPSKARKRKLLK